MSGCNFSNPLGENGGRLDYLVGRRSQRGLWGSRRRLRIE
jgi:hypothetical protein